jgi:RimJ/RimL family protein N-acetyltransferase
MQLKSERLLLREFVESDFTELREIESDPEIFRYRSRTAISEAETMLFLQECKQLGLTSPQTKYPWAIILQAEHRLVGQIGLTLIPPIFKEGFLWFSLNRKYWSQGIMTEAVSCLLEYGYYHLNLEAIHAYCHLENIASRRVLEKAGFGLVDPGVQDEKVGQNQAECHYIRVKK